MLVYNLDVNFKECAGIVADADEDGVADDTNTLVFYFTYWGSVRFNVETTGTLSTVDVDTVRAVLNWDEYFDGGLALTDGTVNYNFTIRNIMVGSDDTNIRDDGVIEQYNSYHYQLSAYMNLRNCLADESGTNTAPPAVFSWTCN